MSITAGKDASIGHLIAAYWWLAIIFGGAILEWIGDVFSGTARALRRRSQIRHERKVELKRLEVGQPQAQATPVPGPCRHRKAVPVRTNDGDVVAWLCRSCDTKLPADFSIYEEDL